MKKKITILISIVCLVSAFISGCTKSNGDSKENPLEKPSTEVSSATSPEASSATSTEASSEVSASESSGEGSFKPVENLSWSFKAPTGYLTIEDELRTMLISNDTSTTITLLENTATESGEDYTDFVNALKDKDLSHLDRIVKRSIDKGEMIFDFSTFNGKDAIHLIVTGKGETPLKMEMIFLPENDILYQVIGQTEDKDQFDNLSKDFKKVVDSIKF